MAPKRKANEAFSKTPATPLSAFAAARKFRESNTPVKAVAEAPEPVVPRADTAKNGRRQPESQSASRDDVGSIAPISRNEYTAATSAYKILKDDNNSLELRLQLNETATFVGEYEVEVLKGIVEIQGAILLPRSGIQRVYAVSTHAVPSIVGRTDESTIRVSSVQSQLQALEKYSPLFRNVWIRDDVKDRSFAPIAPSTDDLSSRGTNVLETGAEIRRLLSSINGKIDADGEPVRVMAVGPKSSGKSTLNRLLCNAIITRPSGSKCAFLDLDPGQPEFGPPGQVSLIELSTPLLGPPFSHLASPKSPTIRLLRSHTLAATTFKDFPDHYLACAQDLARRIPAGTPVVINSCGWVSGTGASLLVDFCACLGITDVPMLGAASLEDGLRDAIAARVKSIHPLARQAMRPALRSPAELRAMQTLSYFHHRPSRSRGSGSWVDKPIGAFRPWKVRYAGDDAGIEAVISYSQPVHPEFVAEVLNGAVVAMVVSEDNQGFGLNGIAHTEAEDIPNLSAYQDGSLSPLNPRLSSCVGLALIVGIDANRKTFEMVTPLSESQIEALMSKKLALIRGGFDSPDWAYLEDTHGVTDRPRFTFEKGSGERPWVSFRDPVGVEGAVWRLRHPPTASAAK